MNGKIVEENESISFYEKRKLSSYHKLKAQRKNRSSIFQCVGVSVYIHIQIEKGHAKYVYSLSHTFFHVTV